MKKISINKIILVLFVLFGVIKLQGQVVDTAFIDKRIDSVYNNYKDSTLIFSTLFGAINQSKRLNYKSGEVSAMHLLGYIFLTYGKLDSSRKYLFLSHELARGITNQKTIAQNYKLLAIYYETTDQFDKSLSLLFRSLLIWKKINDKKREAGCYISIGVNYQRLGDNTKSIYYYNKAIKYFESVKNEGALASIYSNLGAIYNYLGNVDSAIFYLNNAIIYQTKINDNYGLSKALANIGHSYSYLGNYTKALDCLFRAINLNEGGENNFNNVNAYARIASILVSQRKLKEAEKYVFIAIKMYKKSGKIKSLIETYNTANQLFELKKEYKTAIKYNALSTFLTDSLEVALNKNVIRELEIKYKILEKEQENELLKSENKLLESESKNNTLLVISFLVVLAISVFLALNLTVVKKTKNKLIQKNIIIESKNKEVANQNGNLAHLIEENHSLMGILAHDLRSPFSKILGLSNLLADEKEEGERVVFTNYINSICVESLQLIQDTIDISQIFNEKHNATPLKIEQFLPSHVLNNLMDSFKFIADEKNIKLELVNTIEDIEIINSKEYLTRILDNLISNAIKFSPLNSQITVATIKLNTSLVFSIKDNGPGFSELDKQQLFMRFKKLSARPTANESSSGLGLFIVKQLTNLMLGEIEVISEQSKGSEFILTIPLKVDNNA
jgi:signal transduction histidine kinase